MKLKSSLIFFCRRRHEFVDRYMISVLKMTTRLYFRNHDHVLNVKHDQPNLSTGLYLLHEQHSVCSSFRSTWYPDIIPVFGRVRVPKFLVFYVVFVYCFFMLLLFLLSLFNLSAHQLSVI